MKSYLVSDKVKNLPPGVTILISSHFYTSKNGFGLHYGEVDKTDASCGPDNYTSSGFYRSIIDFKAVKFPYTFLVTIEPNLKVIP